jgi:hypothetical protein
VQIAAVNVEPHLRALMVGTEALNETPEPCRVIHLREMRDFMRREVIEDKGRGEDQPPGI